MNSQMFNSFLDGTKSAIEMAAVANATGLSPGAAGCRSPPCGVDDLPHVLRPAAAGGRLDHKGQVEVVSCLERDGRHVLRDLRWGSTSCSRRRPTTPPPASRSTACAPTPAALRGAVQARSTSSAWS